MLKRPAHSPNTLPEVIAKGVTSLNYKAVLGDYTLR